MLRMGGTSGLNNRYLGVLLIGLVGASLSLFGYRNYAEGGPTGVPFCAPSDVPAQAWDTIELVEQDGPYLHPETDDKRFGNYEGVLPDEELGYYREYTVETPGLGHRGERRIVTGGGDDGEVDEWYYTGDHYESFCEVPGV
ncbi:ribonuclease [Corynebacterium mycetoides]|uniref:Ribonuclease n=1 Tax=Corynebacterium mycetoides TaxID=38302 RepID=A0A1G9NIH6_9CORY|nr:ribonuclease [Corynebacterium mycetoides]